MNQETNELLSNMDIALRVWAVLGPLAVGAIGAIWARRIHIADRVYAESQEQQQYEREFKEKNSAKVDENVKSWCQEIRETVIRLETAAQIYISAQSDAYSGSMEDDNPLILRSLHEMHDAGNRVQFLGDPTLAKLSVKLINTAVVVPCDYASLPEDHDSKIELYHNSMTALTDRAREFINGIRDHHKSTKS